MDDITDAHRSNLAQIDTESQTLTVVEQLATIRSNLSAFVGALFSRDPSVKIEGYKTLFEASNAYISIDDEIRERLAAAENFFAIVGIHTGMSDAPGALAVLDDLLQEAIGDEDMNPQQKADLILKAHMMLSARLPDLIQIPSTHRPLEIDPRAVIRNLFSRESQFETRQAAIGYLLVTVIAGRLFSPNLRRSLEDIHEEFTGTRSMSRIELLRASFSKTYLEKLNQQAMNAAVELLMTDCTDHPSIVSVAPPGVNMIGPWQRGALYPLNGLIHGVVQELTGIELTMREAVQLFKELPREADLYNAIVDRLPNIAFVHSALFPNQVTLSILTGKYIARPGLAIKMGPSRDDIAQFLKSVDLTESEPEDDGKFSVGLATQWRAFLGAKFAEQSLDWIMEYGPQSHTRPSLQRRAIGIMTGWIDSLGDSVVVPQSKLEEFTHWCHNQQIDLTKHKRFRRVCERAGFDIDAYMSQVAKEREQ